MSSGTIVREGESEERSRLGGGGEHHELEVTSCHLSGNIQQVVEMLEESSREVDRPDVNLSFISLGDS